MISRSKPIPNTRCIESYFHCGQCIEEMPAGTSPQRWSQLEVGFTPQGLQVWCKRHDCNVVHIDFAGQRFRANTTCVRTSSPTRTLEELEDVDVARQVERKRGR